MKARIYKELGMWYCDIPDMGWYEATSFYGIMRHWRAFLKWAQ